MSQRVSVAQATEGESQRVTVKQAAREIGVCEEYLRRQMQAGEMSEIGDYIKPQKGQKKATYLIFREKLNKYLGIADSEKETAGAAS